MFGSDFGFWDVDWFSRPIVVSALCHVAVGSFSQVHVTGYSWECSKNLWWETPLARDLVWYGVGSDVLPVLHEAGSYKGSCQEEWDSEGFAACPAGYCGQHLTHWTLHASASERANYKPGLGRPLWAPVRSPFGSSCFGSRFRYLTSTNVDSKGKNQARLRIGWSPLWPSFSGLIGFSFSFRLFRFLTSFSLRDFAWSYCSALSQLLLWTLSILFRFVILRDHTVPHFHVLFNFICCCRLCAASGFALLPLPGWASLWQFFALSMPSLLRQAKIYWAESEVAATFHVSHVSHFVSYALLEGLPRKGQLIICYVWVSIWNTHVLNHNGHQLSVHYFFVQLYPSIYSCFPCTAAYFTLWRRCFPLGFHQSPRSSHSCLLAISTLA